MQVYHQIFEILKIHAVQYEKFEHIASDNCTQAANERGLDLSVGAKSILFKAKNDFVIFTIRAHLEVDSNKVRKILGVNKLRFATNNELMANCHVVKGALAPLVSKLYGIPHFIDKSLQTGEKIAFNAGVLTESVVISTQDFLRLIDGQFCEFSK